MFALPMPDELPVVAWSAGAMALTSKVVLFHDYAPRGSHEAEVFDRGLGRVPGVIALPHARRRLRLEDRARCVRSGAPLPRPPAACSSTTGPQRSSDRRSAVAAGADGAAAAYGLLPHGVRVLRQDGVVEQVGPA